MQFDSVIQDGYGSEEAQPTSTKAYNEYGMDRRPSNVSNNGQQLADPQRSSKKILNMESNTLEDELFPKGPKATANFSSVRAELARQANLKKPSRFKSQSKKTASNNVTQFDNSVGGQPSIHYKNSPRNKATRTEYAGQLVGFDKSAFQPVNQLRSQYMVERLKKCLAKKKCVLFEDKVVQIGQKTSLVNDQTNGTILNLEIFIGNKSQSDTVQELKLVYEGDKTNLLYCRPQKIDETVRPLHQVKHDLMVFMTQVPNQLIRMSVSYRIKNVPYHQMILLPNSILKFTQGLYIDLDMLVNEFGICKEQNGIYRSEIFRLGTAFKVKDIKKDIPQLVELTSYDEFKEAGNPDVEYKLGCGLLVLNTHQFLLKIRIRVDMTCIIQMGTINDSQDCLVYLQAYMNALQFALSSS